MVVSMDASGRHKGTAGYEVDQYANARYEHYLAEQDMDDSEGTLSSPSADIITPLASDQIATGGGACMQHAQNEQAQSGPTPDDSSIQDDKNKLRNASLRLSAASNTFLFPEGYFSSQPHRSSPSSRRALGPQISSNQSSSGSLHALSEHDGLERMQMPLRRAMSTKSNPGHVRTRSASQTKIQSFSQPGSKRPSNGDQLVYPDQSFASLQAPAHQARPHPVLRTRSSHPAQNVLYSEMSKFNKISTASGVRTADNTPMSSPGLFTPTSMRQHNLNDGRSSNSQLHHLQAPRETHTAEIDHDNVTGNKFINQYEVMRELGRGEHGKVKLGRDMGQDGHLVAIKIVPRYSTKRRLGKVSAAEDITKREVAILKKARHPNVVSLLEVIDDPNKNKVYLILEHVEKGEIKWRKHGVKEILAINNQRFEQEKLGVNLSAEPSERDLHIVHLAHVRHDRLEQMKRANQGLTHVPNWSLEYAGETDDESEMLEATRTMSRQYSHVSSPTRGNSGDEIYSSMMEAPLSGSMYGSYMPEVYRNRKFSLAISHMSSEMNFEQDDDQRSYVPALTLEEAQRTFRNTLLGLEFLHFIGIIHRDIKPANLLVSSNGTVKISDFGVSYLGRPITEEEADRKLHDSDAAPLDDEKELARSVGTPAFWAPELCYESTSMFSDQKEPKITGALDLWALGITLYCMIYARLPFYHNETMGLHEAVCTAEVFCPKTRLVPVDTTSSEHVSRPTHSINSNKRLDYELKFEHVPEELRDLIKRLLIKDPAHRITIAEAKKHPWVTEGMSDKEFLQNPEIAKESKKKILEMSDKEIDRAVVKRNFTEKISNTVGRIVGSLLGRKDTRKRASTTASSAGSSTDSLHSPTSTTSTVGKADRVRESRRSSLRGDELLQALKASRDAGEHHPLAQSQTASPDNKDSPESTPPGYFEFNVKAASAGATPASAIEYPNRPRGPDRAASALSTADSVKTIRPSYHMRIPTSDPALSSSDLPHSEPSLRSRVEGLWEGTTKTFTRLASRDRRSNSARSRSRSRPPSENDGHAGPSLAVSTTYASGAFQTSNAYRATDVKSETLSPVSLSQSVDMPRHSPFRVPSSDHAAFEQAQQTNQRRQIQESLSNMSAASIQQNSQADDESCPPSPDDLLFTHQSMSPSAQISPSDLPISVIPTAVSASSIASSIDGYGKSSVSQSISNPSMGIISSSSSPPYESFFDEHKIIPHEHQAASNDDEPDFMRTADTVVSHGRPTTPTATGKPLQAELEYFDDGDCDSDSSDEEGIVMGGPKKH